MGVIDMAAESALLAVSGSDIVLIAVPVSATEATFKAIRHLVEPGVLFMDVGSTKRDVIDAARRVLKERVRASCRRTRSPARKWPASACRRALYTNRQVILTPIAQTDPTWCRRPPTCGRRSARRCCA
jgi:prephenate dehydrogenase